MKIEVVSDTVPAASAVQQSRVVEPGRQDVLLERAYQIAQHAQATRDVGLLASALMLLLDGMRR